MPSARLWLSGHAAQHHRLDLQSLCIAAQDVIQSCHLLRTRSVGTRQVEGVASAQSARGIEYPFGHAMTVGGRDWKQSKVRLIGGCQAVA